MPPPITVRSALAELLDIDHAVLHEVSDGPPACGVEELGTAAFDVLAQPRLAGAAGSQLTGSTRAFVAVRVHPGGRHRTLLHSGLRPLAATDVRGL